LYQRTRDSFGHALFKWAVKSYGLALLPLIAKAWVVGTKDLSPEACLFVLVLAATGICEVLFDDGENGFLRTTLGVTAISCVLYGGEGYARLSAAEPFPGLWLLRGLLWGLVGIYFLYKAIRLRDDPDIG
jgi:hypothetical protein